MTRFPEPVIYQPVNMKAYLLRQRMERERAEEIRRQRREKIGMVFATIIGGFFFGLLIWGSI